MRSYLISAIAFLILLIPALPTLAENYVSSNGGFYITYPDEWQQVDYNTVDYYLRTNQASNKALNYEAVFALKTSVPFHAGPYIILSIDTVGLMSDPQIDSILENLSKTFGEGIKYFPTGDYLTDLKSQAPNYDAERKEITILNDITEQYKVVKRNLWVIKLYEKGLANFYFFSHDSSFAETKPVFHQIVSSFSTENIEAALPKQQYKLADIEETPDIVEESDSLTIFGLPIGVAVILIIIIAARRRKKQIES